ncbi:hypothetical protein T01_4998 [Trichinella spiralis]|uniref:Uncharacterized protein n=2 Tax=Trichinella spiralis TaxID=6334 RepID=A0A0V1B9L1_TRISP|nr:hypothetical protein T01_4998 [Trichinella spiralis]
MKKLCDAVSKRMKTTCDYPASTNSSNCVVIGDQDCFVALSKWGAAFDSEDQILETKFNSVSHMRTVQISGHPTRL